MDRQAGAWRSKRDTRFRRCQAGAWRSKRDTRFRRCQAGAWRSNRTTRHEEVDDLKPVVNDEFRQAIELAKSHPNVFTPAWLLDGFIDYLQNDFTKRCPYLDMPTLGSKFFIDPDGEVEVCIGNSIGNLLESSPEEIFTSAAWWNKLREFKECRGCWNSCFTLATSLSPKYRSGDMKQFMKLAFPRVLREKR